MSDFEFVLVEKIGFTLQKTVFEFVIGGGRGATGAGLPTGGTVDQMIKKSSLVDHVIEWFTLTKDFIGLGNVTDHAQLKRSAGDYQAFTQKISPELPDSVLGEDSSDGENKKRFTLDGIKTLFQTAFNAVYALIASRDDHGTISTGSEEISGNFSDHTLTTGGDHTWTFADFSESKNSFAMKLIVSSGTPTITLTTWTIAVDSAQTLSAMAAGTYIVVGKTFDGGTSGQITVIDSV